MPLRIRNLSLGKRSQWTRPCSSAGLQPGASASFLKGAAENNKLFIKTSQSMACRSQILNDSRYRMHTIKRTPILKG